MPTASPALVRAPPTGATLAALAALALGALAWGQDQDSVDGSDAIPGLGSDALGSLWPALAPHLPSAIGGAGATAEGASHDDRMLASSAWAGVLEHPSAALSWGVGVLGGDDQVDEGPGIPSRWRSVRAVAGLWRRYGLDDHLVLVTAPGVAWSTPGAGTAWTIPLAGLWIHRAGHHLVWAVGAVALFWEGRPVALPIAGAQWLSGPWTLLASPLGLSAERLLTPRVSAGAALELAGDSAPLMVAGRRATAVVWQARAVARTRWSVDDHWSLAAEGGWEPERHLLISERDLPTVDRRLHTGVVASASTLLTW